MGSLVSELGLDLKLLTKRTVNCFLKKEMKLKDFVTLLEEERRKIEAFKRELPLCMILVNDVIDELKLEVEQCQNSDCVIEEFMAYRSREDKDKDEHEEVKLEKNSKEKMDWMSSAQLWNHNCNGDSVMFREDSCEKKNGYATSLESKSRNPGIGAFLPLKIILDHDPPANAMTVASDNPIIESAQSTSAGSAYLVLQAQRKARRCWSPELHRRFVVALQQLGGAQAATPKQIRELMMVEGLRNDEVKSHLQKYRLHTRRTPNSSASEVNRPVSTAGNISASQDQWQTSHPSASQFGSPQGPLQLACNAQAIWTTGGDSCDDDRKSGSYNWK